MKASAPIVVGIDFSPASPTALKHASRLAAHSGVPLIAVHVFDSSSVAHWFSGRSGDKEIEPLRQAADKKLAELIEEHAAGFEVRREVLSGKPAEEIQRVIEREDAGLLVIAANDFTKKRLGTSASACVRLAQCDVLVLRDWQEEPLRRIVACVDLSATTPKVLAAAIEKARDSRAELEVVHVIFPPEADLWGKTFAEEGDFIEQSRAEASGGLERALEPFAEELSGLEHRSTILESKVPSMALTFHVEDRGADLVVLGTRVHSKIGAFFTGTNAERLLHDTPVSVLAVRS